MGAVGGIAQQHDVVVIPALAGDAREIEPGRAAQMLRVAHQAVAAEMALEQHLAGGDAVRHAHPIEAEPPPGGLVALDDEGRGRLIEAIGVRPDPAVLGLLEDESEGVEQPIGAEPDVFVAAQLDARPKCRGEALAHAAVDAVRRDDQIGVAISGKILDLALELQPDAEAARALLQDVQQALAGDAGKAMAARADDVPLEVDVDVVPVLEGCLDRGSALGVVLPEIGECLVREHHAPAEGVVGAVALDHQHVVRRVAQLHRDREVEPRRASADADDLHAAPAIRGAHYLKLKTSNSRGGRRQEISGVALRAAIA